MKSAALAFALFAAAGVAQAQEPLHVWSVETPKDAEAALRFGLPDTEADWLRLDAALAAYKDAS